jgi:YHS domain-containing protein
MFRFIFFVLVILVLYYILHYLIKDMSPRRKSVHRESDPDELVQDPCCQTYVPKRSAVRRSIAGKNHYFCSQACLERFLQRKE